MEDKKEKSQVTKYFVQRIEEWLASEMEKDPQFKARVEAVKGKKTVEGACNYVLKCAKDSGQCLHSGDANEQQFSADVSSGAWKAL